MKSWSIELKVGRGVCDELVEVELVLKTELSLYPSMVRTRVLAR